MSQTPSSPILRWAADAVGSSARVVSVRGLKEHQGPQPTWMLSVEHDAATVEVVLKTGPLSWTSGFRSEAAGMAFAEENDLPAPRLLASELDGTFGVYALLSTAFPGSSAALAEPSTARLRQVGAAAARLHAIPLTPQPPDLPLRTHHIPHDDYTAERRWAAQYQSAPDEEKKAVFAELVQQTGWPPRQLRKVVTKTRTTPMLQAAEDLIARIPAPDGDTVFVHGDLHTGNTLWVGEELVGITDWDSAGSGNYGVDLGSLRLEAALHYDLAAADEIVHGWQQATGQPAEHLAYWDVVSALPTPAGTDTPGTNVVTPSSAPPSTSWNTDSPPKYVHRRETRP